MGHAVTLTLAEASHVLDPPISETQLRAIITALRWEPAAWRPRNGRGHPWPEYDATRIIRLHAALLPFLPLEELLCAWYPMPGGHRERQGQQLRQRPLEQRQQHEQRRQRPQLAAPLLRLGSRPQLLDIHGTRLSMPRWLIYLIAALVILVIAILWVTHVHLTVH